MHQENEKSRKCMKTQKYIQTQYFLSSIYVSTGQTQSSVFLKSTCTRKYLVQCFGPLITIGSIQLAAHARDQVYKKKYTYHRWMYELLKLQLHCTEYRIFNWFKTLLKTHTFQCRFNICWDPFEESYILSTIKFLNWAFKRPAHWQLCPLTGNRSIRLTSLLFTNQNKKTSSSELHEVIC